MFAGLAVYLAIGVVRNFLVMITIAFREFSFASVGFIIFSLLLSGAYLAAIIYFLVLKSHSDPIRPVNSNAVPAQSTEYFCCLYCIISRIT